MRGLTVSMFRHAKNSTLSFSHKGNFTSKVLCEGKKNTQLELLCMTFDKWLRGPKRQKHVEFSKNKTQLSRKIMKVCVICKKEYYS